MWRFLSGKILQYRWVETDGKKAIYVMYVMQKCKYCSCIMPKCTLFVIFCCFIFCVIDVS